MKTKLVKQKEICYKYKDGRFLKISYMGDGEYELILTENLTTDCIFYKEWPLSEILECCDGVYDDSDEYIADALEEYDFVIHNTETKIEVLGFKNKKRRKI
jgi:hypothetical protein